MLIRYFLLANRVLLSYSEYIKLCVWDRPPLCLFVKAKHQEKTTNLSALRPNIIPIYPSSSPVPSTGHTPSRNTKNISIQRFQLPVSPAFAITDYKSQGLTFDNAVLDLRRPTRETNQKCFHSVYVMLSRLKSWSGLQILRPFPIQDIQHQPLAELFLEYDRLNLLQQETLAKLG